MIRPNLALTHKGGQGTSAWVALATNQIILSTNGKNSKLARLEDETFDLSSLAGKTIYGVKMFFDHDSDVKDYKFNLGQLSIC